VIALLAEKHQQRERQRAASQIGAVDIDGRNIKNQLFKAIDLTIAET